MMNVEIEFRYGPLQVEVESEGEEEYAEVLEDIADFIDKNETLFSQIPEQESPDDGEKAGEPTELSDYSNSEEGNEHTDEDVLSWQKMVEESGVSKEKLRYMFGVEEGVVPHILFGDKLTDESNTEQMLQGTLLILAVWEDYYGNESLITEEIVDSLKKSGLQHDNYYNVYQRGDFSTYFIRDEVEREEGGGETSEISLTPPGKSKAYELIEEYSKEIDV
jgi:hypothetical protein